MAMKNKSFLVRLLLTQIGIFLNKLIVSSLVTPAIIQQQFTL